VKKILDIPSKIRYTTTCKEKTFTGGAPYMNQNVNKFDKLEEIVWLSILYDFYGELLNDHKKQIFEDYILNDLSLSEISDVQGISRQGVYDIVKRCSQELKDYEEKLKLVSKFQFIKEKLNCMKEVAAQARQAEDIAQIGEIEVLADVILKEL
jgi:predicted DNA-binding protein YlxM (UPF0122 family)